MAFEPPEQFNIADYFLDARVQEGKGERPAVLTAGAAFTYREIEALANQFGHVLREAGVQPEQRVMIALPDGPAFVAALFGALKIGAVVVMVNPQLDRKSTRLNSSHSQISYAVFCLKKKKNQT